MATTMKNGDAQVTFEDQQKINKFARFNSRLLDIKEEMAAKEKELENMTYAEEELMMLEGEADKVPYQIGEVLVEMDLEEAQSSLETAKQLCQSDMDALKEKMESHKQTLSDLKTSLYAKFGTNINLDQDEES